MRDGPALRLPALLAVPVVAAVLAGTLAGTLAGCTSAAPSPSRTTRPGASPSTTASATPALVPHGTARQNRRYFDAVNERLIAKGGSPHGRDFIDSLVAAGFDKADMQVTPDTTTVGLAADNIQFSVRIGKSCLIGQYGNIGYDSTVLPVLSTGACLAGTTRAIDW